METGERKQQSSQDDVDRPSKPAPEIDSMLRILVKMMNTLKGSLGMTLLVNGAVVSGYVIGGKEYFEAFAKNMAVGFNEDEVLGREVAGAFEAGAAAYDVELDMESVAFLHMRDASIYLQGVAGNNTPLPASLWRVRLSEVSGYTLGVLPPSPASNTGADAIERRQ